MLLKLTREQPPLRIELAAGSNVAVAPGKLAAIVWVSDFRAEPLSVWLGFSQQFSLGLASRAWPLFRSSSVL